MKPAFEKTTMFVIVWWWYFVKWHINLRKRNKKRRLI